jgi:hypothetical protein
LEEKALGPVGRCGAIRDGGLRKAQRRQKAVARKRPGKHGSAKTNTYVTIEERWEAVFSMQSVSRYRATTVALITERFVESAD